MWVEHIQLIELLEEGSPDIFVPFLLLGLLHQFLAFWRAFAVTQLLFDVPDLLLQEVLTLLFIKVLTGTTPDVLLDLLQLELTVHDAQHLDHTLLEVRLLEQFHLLLDGERHTGTDEVQHHQMVVDVLDGKLRLVGNILVLLDVVDTCVAQIGHGGHKLRISVIGNHLGCQMHLTSQVRTGTFQ